MSQFFVEPPGGAPAIPTEFTTDDGIAIPAENNLNIFGGPGISTSGSGDTVTINASGVIPAYTPVVGPDTYIVDTFNPDIPDYYISCNTSLGDVTIQLPNITSLYRAFVIKDRTGTASTNNITITTVAGILMIDGNPNIVLEDNYDDVQILYNGTAYEIY